VGAGGIDEIGWRGERREKSWAFGVGIDLRFGVRGDGVMVARTTQWPVGKSLWIHNQFQQSI
jgi:hypothetical protein